MLYYILNLCFSPNDESDNDEVEEDINDEVEEENNDEVEEDNNNEVEDNDEVEEDNDVDIDVEDNQSDDEVEDNDEIDDILHRENTSPQQYFELKNKNYDDIFGKPLSIYNSEKIRKYYIDAKIILPYINQDWLLNRNIDENHVKNISSNVKNLLGQLYFVNCCHQDNKLLLIDGQHRREAIKKILSTKTDINFKIFVDVINVNSEDDIIAYFNRINNVKPMHSIDIPDLQYKNLVISLADEFPKAFLPESFTNDIKNDNSDNRPLTTMRKLLHFLKSYHIFENYTNTEDYVREKIININRNYSANKNIDRKFGKDNIDIARETGFYLLLENLDSNNKWIKILELYLAKKEIINRGKKKIVKIKIRVKK